MHTVQIQFIRICLTVAILLGVGLWQFDFVLGAVRANPALNLIIFGTCLFGFSLVFSAINSLKNEYRALYAIEELYEDVKYADDAVRADPLWKYYRANTVGIIYKKPQILGQCHQLICGQLYREKELQISPSTLQTLLDGIDERLAEVKSLISYVAGILIFLGLIGTFLGLMITLASVGDILGTLDLTSSDPTATITNLMDNLQTPLAGMATGFSSSLFGLVTSLATSLMIQLLSRAGSTLKSDMANWLSNVVDLTGAAPATDEKTIDGFPLSEWVKHQERTAKIGPDGQYQQITSREFEERRLALLMRAARHSVVSTNRHSREFAKLTRNIDTLVTDAQETKEVLLDLGDALRVIGEQNKVIHLTLARTVDAFDTISRNVNTRAEIAELTALMSSQLETRDARLTSILRQTLKKVSELSAPLAIETQTIEKPGAHLAEALGAELTDVNVQQLKKLLMLANRLDAVAANKGNMRKTQNQQSATARRAS
ncbi:MAG: hypothetical protein AAF720_08135 [Pseudomonadota bacterium]